MNPAQPLLSAAQIRAWDAYTIACEPVASIDLMERAARELFFQFITDFGREYPVIIICGKGNNGGDGLALARIMTLAGIAVRCIMALGVDNLSPDAAENLIRLKEMGAEPIELSPGRLDEFIQPETIIIDALFGTGISRPLEGEARRWVQVINLPNAKVLSIDLPSGLPADRLANMADFECVQADFTYTFQTLKPAMLMPEGGKAAGNVKVLDIGLHPDFSPENPVEFWANREFIRSIYKKRNAFSHKGTYGKCLIIAGSAAFPGAAALACKGALHSGTGLVALSSSARVKFLTALQLPEVVYNSMEMTPDYYDAVCLGPGMGQDEYAVNMVDIALGVPYRNLLLDADALNIISKQGWLSRVPTGSILTPHPAEFQRLSGAEARNRSVQIEALKDISIRQGIFILLKGHFSVLGTPNGELYFNTTGNAGLAKGGSGDVLAGLITGLWAQGYQPKEAAIMGSWIHGLSAEIAIAEGGPSEESLVPSALCRYFGTVFRELSCETKNGNDAQGNH